MNKFTFTFVVGIDISSKTSVISILKPRGEAYGKKLTITNNLAGFKKLHSILDDISYKFSVKPNIFMESTGLYHILLYNYFSKCGFNCYVINPIKTKNFAKQSIRKVKTDKVDSLRIAQLSQSPTFVNEAKEMNITLTALSVEIITWINIIKALSNACEELTLSIINLHKQIPALETNVSLLCTHPEVGFISAVSFLSEIGDINNFKNSKKIVAFVGLDSSVSQSGDFTSTHNKLSKRGSSFARKILFNLAIASIKTRRNGVAANPILLEYYKKLYLRKPKKVAICAVMHKLVNHFFAILREQKPFELRLPETHEKLYKQNILKSVV